MYAAGQITISARQADLAGNIQVRIHTTKASAFRIPGKTVSLDQLLITPSRHAFHSFQLASNSDLATSGVAPQGDAAYSALTLGWDI